MEDQPETKDQFINKDQLASENYNDLNRIFELQDISEDLYQSNKKELHNDSYENSCEEELRDDPYEVSCEEELHDDPYEDSCEEELHDDPYEDSCEEESYYDWYEGSYEDNEPDDKL
ncbi:hypothetical protein F8M41_019695 [Gigaspora margarita]|uniref:Uncharacterized protein n=1 Tax=Gigaspora margarita TaxID=4874 RepID=A0A8H4EKF7_GIGMA|nr:hypothetical protein F8M41_019695 [Gigaspora margarita]